MRPTGPCSQPTLPPAFFRGVADRGVRLTRDVLHVQARSQRLWLLRRVDSSPLCEGALALPQAARSPARYSVTQRCLISTSRFGLGQRDGSNCTPLGLHRIAEKIGGGWPVGAAFKSRELIGFTWQGLPNAAIAHRILWLDGLQPGLNRGPGVDSHDRYIYIHGVGDELTLGRPASCGCIHLAAKDLIPLFDRLSPGTLVWIEAT